MYKFLFVFGLIVAAAVAAPDGGHGSAQDLLDEELEKATELLDKSLTTLAAGEGPVYTIDKVNSATYKLVAGELYTHDADLLNEQQEIEKCIVHLWQRVWLNSIQMTFKCEGQEAFDRTITME